MQEFYDLIEEKILAAGYDRAIDGCEIYDSICNEIEDKENGTYLFMTKPEDDVIFEYKIDIFDDQFNLSYLNITMPDKKIHVDFDK